LFADVLDYVLSASGDWRAMVEIATVPAVLIFAGMLVLPESPRWPYARGNVTGAREVLSRARPDVDAAIADIRDHVTRYDAGYREIFGPRAA
jgi:Sugar (and other) transporter